MHSECLFPGKTHEENPILVVSKTYSFTIKRRHFVFIQWENTMTERAVLVVLRLTLMLVIIASVCYPPVNRTIIVCAFL